MDVPLQVAYRQMDATIVFTDGAAKGNPGPGGWGVIVVTPEGHVTELGGGSPHTTNNKMELSGAIAALQHVDDHPAPVAIYTDSTYVIQGITQWVWGWRKRNWKTAQGGDVLNRDLWERLAGLAAARGSKGVDWRWVRGHVGTPGNERVDEIAVAFALQEPPAPLSRASCRIRAGHPAGAGRNSPAEEVEHIVRQPPHEGRRLFVLECGGRRTPCATPRGQSARVASRAVPARASRKP